MEDWNRSHPSQLHGGGTGFLSSMFGSVSNVRYLCFVESGGTDPSQPGAVARPTQPLSFIERKRQEAQKTYELEARYFKEHEEEFKQ